MIGKFRKWQKVAECLCFLMILGFGIYKALFGNGDTGVTIMMITVAIVLFSVLCVAALFPSTWRMTDKEKSKIADMARYQENYTTVFVIINMILSLIMVLLIWIVG